LSSRVPDVRFLLDHLLSSGAWDSEACGPEARGPGVWNSELTIDPERVGIVGHSLGAWTALATPEVDQRIQAVVPLAPGGSSNPRLGILPGKLTFQWSREIPSLYLVGLFDNVQSRIADMELLSFSESGFQSFGW
jgi:hypothetical protein